MCMWNECMSSVRYVNDGPEMDEVHLMHYYGM